tara:strand:- start:395 stop:640 length:246 start_codon:yes stop_codon:yes gene_type:complete
MAKKNSSYRTIRTLEGIVMSVYEYTPGKYKLHSQSGPAVIYPKGINKPDEYHIYGVPYKFLEWQEISRPARKAKNKEDFAE